METTITFQGKDYLLLGDLITGGPIATKKQYENGHASHAHLYLNGEVKRFGKVIGDVSQIEVTGETTTRIKATAFDALLTHISWFGP